MAEFKSERHERHERTKLHTTDQLPELESPPEKLTWDVTDAPVTKGEVLILMDDRVIWREMSFYENYARFVEIASLLHRKYGTALRDLEPTRRSELDLYGDWLPSLSVVEKARNALKRGEDPAATY